MAGQPESGGPHPLLPPGTIYPEVTPVGAPANPCWGLRPEGKQVPLGGPEGVFLPPGWAALPPTVPTWPGALPDAPTAPATLPPRSTVSWTFFRKSRSRQRLESRMVVAYVDSVMSRLGRHLSIQAALEQWGSYPKVDRPHATGLGAMHWPPAQTWPGPLAGSCPSAQGQALTCHGKHSRGDRKHRL